MKTKIKYKIHCSTCPDTIEVSSAYTTGYTLPPNWERDKLGELHCGKCMRLARALMAEDRRRRANGDDE